MNKTITLNAGLGASLGPNFNLTANLGALAVSPPTATLVELLAGKDVVVDDLAATITITSAGLCVNSLTLPIVDIYYGTGITETVDANFIISNFSRLSGNIGSPTGRNYLFGVEYSYYFWAIPDEPSGSTSGYRVVQYIKWPGNPELIGLLPQPDDFYYKFQSNPTPPGQSLTYGYVDIYGIRYRLYRTTETYIDGLNSIDVFSF